MEENSFEISVLPLLGLREDFFVYGVRYTHSDDFVKKSRLPSTVYEKLKTLFDSYIGKDKNPLSTIFVVHIDGKNFAELEESDFRKIHSSTDILLFAINSGLIPNVIANNTGNVMLRSSEDFKIQHLVIRENSEFVSINQNGRPYIVKLDAKKELDANSLWRCGDPDKDILTGIENYINSSISNEQKERMLRSLEWYRFAHMNSYSIFPMSRVIMMVTAFEVLLDIPKGFKANIFSKKINELLDEQNKSCDNEKFVIFKKEKRDIDKKPVERILPAWWAYDFYELRNMIVHGGVISEKNLHFSETSRIDHLNIADLVFFACISTIIEDYVDNSDENISISPFIINLRRAYRELGWLD